MQWSTDGITFNKISSVTAKNIAESFYNFTDPDNLNSDTYYRLKMNDADAVYKYSKVVHLGIAEDFEVKNIINPFRNSISMNVIVAKEGTLIVTLHNEKGQLVKSLKVQVNKGIDNIVLDNIEGAVGVYFLSLDFNNKTIKRKLVKMD